ncbi:MAG: hypothetical protein LLG45_10330 [Actinomycetia bacterium]|nr:hypothetical protein [Actinomycetes bacterium]
MTALDYLTASAWSPLTGEAREHGTKVARRAAPTATPDGYPDGHCDDYHDNYFDVILVPQRRITATSGFATHPDCCAR